MVPLLVLVNSFYKGRIRLAYETKTSFRQVLLVQSNEKSENGFALLFAKVNVLNRNIFAASYS